jgi:SulP family sulfate permease
VVLRLRGRNNLGATLVEVLANYADKLKAANGRLYLTGISEGAYKQVVRTGKLRLTGPVRAYEATPVRGQSTEEAVADARTWLVDKGADASPNDASSSTREGEAG